MIVLIPCAGKGSRFADAGYKEFKPFLPLNGKTMLECVVENVSRKDDKVIVITRPEYADKVKYQKIITGKTEGAACTILKAKEFLDGEVLIANSDQLVNIDINDFIEHARKYDGCILTFPNDNPKWSYAKVDGELVIEVAEKVVVSDKATVGIYYFKEGKELVKAINRMIEDDLRVKGEYYLCPAYNYYPRHKKIGFYNIKESKMWGLGTPTDYEVYNDLHNL